MKKLFVLFLLVVLSACGTIGIGSNHQSTVYNNSENTINVKSDTGVYKIKPESSMTVSSANDITITSTKKMCAESTVARTPNTAAMILDVFPGFIIGIVPILVDAISNNLYKMPDSYSYSCM